MNSNPNSHLNSLLLQSDLPFSPSYLSNILWHLSNAEIDPNTHTHSAKAPFRVFTKPLYFFKFRWSHISSHHSSPILHRPRASRTTCFLLGTCPSQDLYAFFHIFGSFFTIKISKIHHKANYNKNSTITPNTCESSLPHTWTWHCPQWNEEHNRTMGKRIQKTHSVE